jgi:hypothetical protein
MVSDLEDARRREPSYLLGERDMLEAWLGEPVSLRWIYVHMIEEYARHNGHTDLLREMVDGAVGW